MLTAEPRPYQSEPLEVFYERGNILLAFDTGLGKTYCAIAAAEHLLETAQVDRVLLIVPAGLKYQWAEAIAAFTDLPTQRKRFKNEWITIPDSRYCMVIDGTVAKRKKQYAMAQDTPSCNYVIVGFDNITNDERYVKRLQADFAVLDEATAIKTLSAARTVAIKEKIRPTWRMALTATPIDNRPDELFSIMEWVDAEVLGKGEYFDLAYIERDQYGNVTGYKNLPVLRRRLGDAMYRKSVDDPDVAPFMPDRKILSWPVEMDRATREVYTKMAWDLLEALDSALEASGGRSFSVASHYAGTKRPDESTPVGRAMSRHMAMEMLLDHPEVLFASGLAYLSTDDGDDGSQYAADVVYDDDFMELTYSPKLWLLTEKLDRLMADPECKVIIFTRYRRMLELIQYTCDERGWGAVSYHGMLNTAEQQAARARFLTKPDCRVFVSTHAGERGTDLPVANWLVNYDPVWSSGQADQINGRHMRTSSTHTDIFVANMFYTGSVEDRKIEQQAKKREVSRAIIDGDMPEGGIIRNDVTSLRKHVLEWLQLSDPEGMIDYEISQ